jgi:hypothetical protein
MTMTREDKAIRRAQDAARRQLSKITNLRLMPKFKDGVLVPPKDCTPAERAEIDKNILLMAQCCDPGALRWISICRGDKS